MHWQSQSATRMINQLLAGVHIAAATEAMALGIRAGIDPATLYEVISNSAGASWMFQNRVPHILAGDYTPLSAVNIFVKDLGIVLDSARDFTFPLPLHAVLLGLELELGNRRLAAHAVARAEASEQYERAVDQGHTAALVVHDGNGLYTVSLGNLLAGETAVIPVRIALPDQPGNYTLEVLPQRQYRVEVNAEGYESGSYTFFTDNPSNQSYGQPLFLRKMGAPKPNPIPVTPTPTPEKPSPAINAPVVPFPVGETYTLRGTSNSDNLEYQSNAPRHNGIYYKIQLVAASKYNPTDPSFSKLSALGVIQTEYIPSRSLTRILLADFMSVAEAKNALAEAKKKGFSAAYIVKYENGVRYGKTNL